MNGSASARLDKGIENCKKTFDKKFKTLNLEYNQKLLSLRSDVEQMREGIPKAESSLSLLSKSEQLLESSRKMLTQLAGFFDEGQERLSKSMSEHDQTAESSRESEDVKEFRDKRFEFFQSKRQIKELEDRADADLYLIQDNLKKASLLAKENDIKADKSKEEMQKIKRIQSSLEMNKKSIRDKIKALSEKATAIEIKFAVIARQKGLEPKDFEDRLVKVSVISKDEMSSFDPSLLSAI